ncbi:protein LKAAEAR1-like [Liolophura sinensis]|uniref:protein LKAAEAR1-like n=1 Tax=Liolophura sinensis TaxID=3198878 RepID=UPI0031588DFB
MGDTLPPINKGHGAGEVQGSRGKFHPRNWKKLGPSELKKLTPLQRSRYLAYEDPDKVAAEAQGNSQKRLIDKKKSTTVLTLLNRDEITEEDLQERDKNAKLIGQLKAAEARNRLRIMRLRYQANRDQEICHLIACQPTALKAVRLQALVPSSLTRKDVGDPLDKLNRHRIESLLEDERGLLTNRIA